MTLAPGWNFFRNEQATPMHKQREQRYKATLSLHGVVMAKPVAEKLNPGIQAAVRRMLAPAPRPAKPAKAATPARKAAGKGKR